MGVSPESGNTPSDSEMSWCLRALVHELASGNLVNGEDDRFKRSTTHLRYLDAEDRTFQGHAGCTVEGTGNCGVSHIFSGERVDGTSMARIAIDRENFGHRALCHSPPVTNLTVVIDIDGKLKAPLD